MAAEKAERGDVNSEPHFKIGMTVCCISCHDDKFEGEVVAFDYPAKALILKCPSTTGKRQTSTIKIINISNMKDIIIEKESKIESLPPLQSLNIPKLSARLKTSIDDKARKASYVGQGVSSIGQSLLNVISKTINEVTWDGDVIVVMDLVRIQPPYKPDDCSLNDSKQTQALVLVQKLVRKFFNDNSEQSLPACPQ